MNHKKETDIIQAAHSTTAEKLDSLKSRDETILKMGGEANIEKQHEKGKLTARERLSLLFDEGSFNEIDRHATHRLNEINKHDEEISSDGVITGFGLVQGRKAFAFAQDFTSRGGSLGEMHAIKISKIMDLAYKAGVPLIGLNDSAGARIQEGVASLAGFGKIFFRNARYSGVIPQISAIMGTSAGGSVYSPALTDWVFMVEKTSHMFITGPKVVKTTTGEDIDFEQLGGAETHTTKSGVAHFSCKNDAEAIHQIKILLSFLPSNNLEDPPVYSAPKEETNMRPELDSIIPDKDNQAYDMTSVIQSVVDEGFLFETHEKFARNIITGFARINGRSVGVIANQPLEMAGVLDIDASDKASRFIRFCNAFNIPLLTFADVPGYLPGKEQEWNGIIRHGAKLLWSYAEATVPKLLVVTRKAYGGAYIAMSSKELGTDMILAWPTAQIAVMGAEGAVDIIHHKEIKKSPNGDEIRKEKIAEYEEHFLNPYTAAKLGYVDAVIEPKETRVKIISALEMMITKRETLPPKKHGNMPL